MSNTISTSKVVIGDKDGKWWTGTLMLKEFNRYHSVQLQLEGAEIGDFMINSQFQSNEDRSEEHTSELQSR